MRRPRLPAIASLSLAVLAAAGVAVGLNVPDAGAATTGVNVTVNARLALATVPDTGVGLNEAVWDSQLGTTTTSDLLKAAGIKMLRYPGGSYGDIYHWQTNTAPGGYVAPGTDFDTFMAAAQRVGAQPMLIANYGTGTPEEAAGWVQYANVTKGYGAKYWTIGNENYGNGLYGADWEADNHSAKNATAYANGVVAFADAMKAVDPTIKVGAVLTMPANWPDGITGTGDPGSWNQTVLSIAGSKIDYVDIHWYPQNASDALTRTSQINDSMFLLRQQIAKYGGANSARLGISLTELNLGQGAGGEDTQPGALFLADAYSGLLENGVFTVNWWDLRNGLQSVSTVAGQTDYADFGILSSGQCTSDGTACEPAANTPFAPYYGLTMMSTFARPGDQLIRAASDQSLVAVHAARRPDGDLAVLLINKDPDNAQPVTIRYEGYTPSAAAPTVYSFTNGATSIASSQTGSATSQTLPAYSLTTLVLHPANPVAGAPGAPGQPGASGVTDHAATISWPAAKAGAHPIAKYEVYRQNGAISEQLGEVTGTSFTVGNLNPGTRYTVNVQARDTAGNVSWSSSPLTFVTGSPATSSCTVSFADANDWGNGYVANVTVTNTGTADIDGWTLTYSWPTSWQQISGGWSANWAQTGADVKITSTPDNARLAAGGGNTGMGTVVSYSGPNILPGVFTLNGTVCTTA